VAVEKSHGGECDGLFFYQILPGITAELLRTPEFVRNFRNPKLSKRTDTPTGIPECDVTLRQGMKWDSPGILRNSDRNGITSFFPEVWDRNEKTEWET
jgi:hypothetical protein